MKKNFIALAMAAVCFAGTASVPAFAASKFADISIRLRISDLWQDIQKTGNCFVRQETM